MATITSRIWLGSAMLGTAGAAWGGLFAVAKSAMDRFDPFTLTLIRYVAAGSIFLILLYMAEGRRSLSSGGKALQLWFFGTLGFAGFGLFAFVGVAMTRPEHAAVIPALIPLIAVVVNALRQRVRPSAVAIFCVALGLIGVATVVTHGDIGSLARDGAGRGELLIFCGATCWVLYTFGAATVPDWSSLRYTALTCAYGLVSIAAAEALALALGVAHVPSLRDVGAVGPELAYLVVFASVIAVLAWNGGIKIVGAVRGVLFINLVPVVAFGIAIAEGHAARPLELAGVGMVTAALILNSLAGASATSRAAPSGAPRLTKLRPVAR